MQALCEKAPKPLFIAILNKQPELVRLLVNRESVDPNALFADTSFSDSTPLHMAVKMNDEELVEILLTDKRINPDLTARPLALPNTVVRRRGEGL